MDASRLERGALHGRYLGAGHAAGGVHDHVGLLGGAVLIGDLDATLHLPYAYKALSSYIEMLGSTFPAPTNNIPHIVGAHLGIY